MWYHHEVRHRKHLKPSLSSSRIHKLSFSCPVYVCAAALRIGFLQEGRKLAKFHTRNMTIPSSCSGQILQQERTFSSSFPVLELLQNSFPKSLSSVDFGTRVDPPTTRTAQKQPQQQDLSASELVYTSHELSTREKSSWGGREVVVVKGALKTQVT